MTVSIRSAKDESCEMCAGRSGVSLLEFNCNQHTFDYALCKSCRMTLLEALYQDAIYNEVDNEDT